MPSAKGHLIWEMYCWRQFSFMLSWGKDFFLQLDEDIIQQVLRMGFDRNQLLESLQTRIQNDVSTLAFCNLWFYASLGFISYYDSSRLLLHTISCSTTDLLCPVAILEVNFGRPWYVWLCKVITFILCWICLAII